MVNHFEQARAHAAVLKAVEKGLLQRPARCSRCRRKGRIQGHHYDGYGERSRLRVVWLCTKCHGREHRKPKVGRPFMLRMPDDLRFAAKVAAAVTGLTIGDLILDAMRKHPAIKAEQNGKEKR